MNDDPRVSRVAHLAPIDPAQEAGSTRHRLILFWAFATTQERIGLPVTARRQYRRTHRPRQAG